MINILLMLVLVMPCILGVNVLGNVSLHGKSIMDMEDFIVSNVLLPGGSLMYVIFCSYKFGWGYNNFENEVNTGSDPKLPKWIKPYFKYVLPIIILIVLIMSIVNNI